MNKIIKFAIAASIVGPALLASSAFAATISNPVFSNGDVTIDATGGSTVSGTFTLQVGTGEVCEVLRTQSDPSQPIKDTSVGGSTGYQWGTQSNVAFSVKVPPNTGTYFPTVQCAGIWGGNHSVDGADGVVTANTPLGTLRVVANTSTGGGLFNGMDIDALVAALKAAGFTITAPGSTTGPSALCANFTAAKGGLMQGMHGAAGLQTFLITNGQGGIITAGATGFYGPQTQAAVNAFVAINHC